MNIRMSLICMLLLTGFSFSGAVSAKPTVLLDNPDPSVFAEEEGLVDKTFLIERSGSNGLAFDMVIQFGGAATLGEDFTVDPVAEACGISGTIFGCEDTLVVTLDGSVRVTIPSGRQDITVTIHPLQDVIDEGDDASSEGLEISISTDSAYNIGSPSSITTRVRDNDTAAIVIADKSGATTSEDGDQMTFTVVLDTEPTENVEVTIASSDENEGVVDTSVILFKTPGNFGGGGDVLWSDPQTITVTGQPDHNGDSGSGTEYDISVEPTDTAGFDDIYRGLGKQDFKLTNLDTGGLVGTIQLSQAAYSGSEALPSIQVRVDRIGGTTGEVTVDYTTTDTGSATAGTDYTTMTDTLTFPDGGATQIFVNIPIIADNELETPDETFTFDLSGVSGGAGEGTLSATVTILNDDQPGEFNLEFAAYTVDEDAGTVSVNVIRSGGSDGIIMVPYTTDNDTASAGTDYTDNDNTLTFEHGDTLKTIIVDITANTDPDGDRIFDVNLGAPTGGATTGSVSNAAVTIEDNDSPGEFNLEFATYTVDEDAGTIDINVVRTGGSGGVVTLDFTTDDDTAAAGTDYTDNDDTLTFVDGDVEETITVSITANDVEDGARVFDVNLGTPSSGTTGSTSNAAVTIEDNDSSGEFAFESATYTVDEDAGTIDIKVVRTGGSDGEVTISYTSDDDTAAAGSDYTDNDDTLTFVDGDVEEIITVAITGNSDVDGDRIFDLNLGTPSAGTTGLDNTAVTIEDNDATGEFSFESATYSVDEDAGTIAINVVRTGGSGGEVTLDFTTDDGTALAGTDYTDNDDTLTFVDGDTEETITVAITGNAVVEGNRVFNVNLGTPSAGTTGIDSAAVTIEDNDLPGTFDFESATYTVDEDAGTVAINVVRTAGSAGEVTISYTTDDGTASAGTDYTDNDDTLTFADGDTEETITVAITANAIQDGDRIFNLNLGTPSAGLQGPIISTAVTIEDNDVAGEFNLESATYTVDEDAGTVAINVVRTGGSAGEVTISYTTDDDTASAGTDYTDNDDTLTFAAGDTEETITVTIIGNVIEDGDRVFDVNLGTPSLGTLGSVDNAAVTIEDNDEAGEFNFASATYSVDEDAGTVAINVVRTGGTGGEVTVPYTTDDDTAAAGTDYTDNDDTLTFTDGDTEETITVSITGNTDPDNDRVFDVNLGTPSSGSTGAIDNTAVTIEDNDQPGELNIEVGPLTIDEDIGTATIVVTRTNGSQGIAMVEYKTTDNTATAGSDFVAPEVAPAATLTWADGESGDKEIEILIIDDATQEGLEDFTVTIENPTVATLGAVVTMTVEINASDTLDEDPGTLSIDPATYTVDEHIGIASVLVTRTGGSDGAVSANWTTVTGTAGAADFTAASGTVSWADQEATAKAIPVSIIDDAEIEPLPEEEFTVVLSDLSGGATEGNLIATVKITDNDEPSKGKPVVANYDTVEMDGVVSVMVSRSSGLDGVLEVNWTTADGAAISGGDALVGEDDYVTNAGTLSWADGDTDQKQIDITIKEDLFPESPEDFKLVLSFDDDEGSPVVVEGAITIYDNDSGGELTIDDVTVNETMGVAILTVRREGSTTGPAFVQYETVDGTARDENSDFDYYSQTGEFSWSPGEGCVDDVCNNGTRQIEIRLVTDHVYEGPETFTVELFNEQGSDGTANSIVVTKRVGTVTLTSPVPIPTLNQWMLMLLALLLGAVGYHQLRRRNQS